MSKKSKRITGDELSIVAGQGFQRAVEARKAAGVELSQDEVSQVGGGVNFGSIGNLPIPRPGIIAGLIKPILSTVIKPIVTILSK